VGTIEPISHIEVLGTQTGNKPMRSLLFAAHLGQVALLQIRMYVVDLVYSNCKAERILKIGSIVICGWYH